MNTEITGNTASERSDLGIVYYDAECRWCRHLAGRWARRLHRQGFQAVPLQTRGVAEQLGVAPAELLKRMHLVTTDGRRLAGADAYIEMARARPWSRPFAWFAALPGARRILRAIYDWLAARRYCGFGVCAAPTNARSSQHVSRWSRFIDLPPLIAGPAIIIALQPKFASWLFMWWLAFVVFAGCKWLTLRDALHRGLPLTPLAILGYLFGWVGMEPREFVHRRQPTSVLREIRWRAPLARVIGGAAFVWLGVRVLQSASSIAAGWVGMIGIILLLHFGMFDLLALAWRAAGFPVKSLMNRPTRSRSIGDFWGARWNRGFHALAHRFLYEPLHHHIGKVGAMLAVFVASGLIHDLVITVPARGGYGLPTGYFVLQGLALALERSPLGRRLGLGGGIKGRIFAIAVVAGPAFWLFPPIFVRNVILPMLQAIGAT